VEFCALFAAGGPPDYEDSGEEMDTSGAGGTTVLSGAGVEKNIDQWSEEMLAEAERKKLAQTRRAETEAADAVEKAVAAAAGGGSGRTSSTDTGTETGMERIPHIYYRIRADRRALISIEPLDGAAAVSPDTGSFEVTGDNRFLAAQIRCSYSRRMNMCTSFNLEHMVCVTCDSELEHTVLHRTSKKVDASKEAPAVFVLADQNFPAFVPATGEGECLKIMRIEDAGPVELAQRLLEVCKGYSIPAGSVVMVVSLSHMVRAGPQQYLYDLRTAFKMMASAFGRAIKLIHGVPVNCCEMNSMAVGSWLEVDNWLKSCAPRARLELASGRLRNRSDW